MDPVSRFEVSKTLAPAVHGTELAVLLVVAGLIAPVVIGLAVAYVRIMLTQPTNQPTEEVDRCPSSRP